MKRYVLEAEKNLIEEVFNVKSGSESLFKPNYNVIPGTTMPVITQADDSRVAASSLWGLDQAGTKNRLTELTYEEVLESKSLSPCIIPASGFYKWKDTVKDPLPFYLRVLSQEVMGIAGVCSSNKNEEGRNPHSYAVLTMPANALVEPLDDTMPVILSPKDYGRWLNEDFSKMIKEGFSGNHLLPDMSVFRVPELVNDSSNNSKELIQPIPKLRNYDDDED